MMLGFSFHKSVAQAKVVAGAGLGVVQGRSVRDGMHIWVFASLGINNLYFCLVRLGGIQK